MDNMEQFGRSASEQPSAPETPAGPAPDAFTKKAKVSFILGIISMITWLLPIIGLPVSIVALVFGIKGIKSTTRHWMAVVGVTLGIISLVLAIGNASIGAYIGAMKAMNQ